MYGIMPDAESVTAATKIDHDQWRNETMIQTPWMSEANLSLGGRWSLFSGSGHLWLLRTNPKWGFIQFYTHLSVARDLVGLKEVRCDMAPDPLAFRVIKSDASVRGYGSHGYYQASTTYSNDVVVALPKDLVETILANAGREFTIAFDTSEPGWEEMQVPTYVLRGFVDRLEQEGMWSSEAAVASSDS